MLLSNLGRGSLPVLGLGLCVLLDPEVSPCAVPYSAMGIAGATAAVEGSQTGEQLAAPTLSSSCVPSQDDAPVEPAELSQSQRTMLSSTCTACQQHVHLVQRYLAEGKLYHRQCFRYAVARLGGWLSSASWRSFAHWTPSLCVLGRWGALREGSSAPKIVLERVRLPGCPLRCLT